MMCGAMSRTIVVGGGVFGVSTALALARRRHDVEILETGPIPRPEAASTDISKIVRMDYGADSLMTEWMEQALPVWQEWSGRWGENVFHRDGFLVLSHASLEQGGFEHDSMATLTALGHRVERLDGGAVGARFPAWSGVTFPDGYFNPNAGWVESARALSLMLGDARAAGVAVRTGDAVERLIERGGAIAGVATASGRAFEADAVVVAAGAWTPRLVSGLDDAMWPVAQPVFHLRPSDPDLWRPPRFTVWAASIATTGWYGFPANADGIVKIAHHGAGRRVDPDAPRSIDPSDEERLREFLRGSLPGLAGAELVHAKTCLYCDSFDGDFWIGRDPDRAGLVVAAGDSGHGLKFAPVIGDVVADALEGRSTPLTKRFGWRAPSSRRTESARFGMS
jgi:glycine/D-amino acid oxidase-like deaminating enzyme